MKAGEVHVLGTQECDHGGSRRAWWRLEDQGKKISPSVLVSEPGIQDSGARDKSASGRNSQAQAQSALKVLKLQLESFQALRQQTLRNVNMVQSEISEILNKNIVDVKRPEFNPDPLLLSSTPLRVAMPRRCQEASLLKNELHLDKRFTQCSETYSNKIFGDSVTDGNVPHHILSKYQSVGKAQAPDRTPREKAILALKNDHKLKNSATSSFSPPWVGFRTEANSALGEIKNYAGHKDSMAFHAGENEHVIDSMSSSFRDMKEDNRKSPRHETPYTFGVQNTSTVLYGKGSDSGYLSEHSPTEKAIGMSNEDFKSKRTSKSEDSVDELNISIGSLKENNQTEGKNQNKEFCVKGNMIEKLQPDFLPQRGQDKSFILEHTEERKKDSQLQLLGTKLELQKQKVLESCDIDAGSDNYRRKRGLLEMSPKEPEPLHKKVVDLQNENTDLKKQMKSLTSVIQFLTEQNSKYQKQIKDLHDEKSNIQERLVKSDSDCKECIKEVKKLLKKCKEYEQRKRILEEKQDQLHAQNQQIMQNLDDFQKKNQEAHESLAALTQEKGDLVVALRTLESQIASLQEEHKVLEEKVSQLIVEKSLLEKKLEEKQKEMQQVKQSENTRQSDIEAVLRRTQSLKEKTLKLEKILQESTDLRKVLQKELEEAQKERDNAKEKLLNECKNTRIETGVLKTKLSNMERECERLSALAGGMKEDNRVLKKEVCEYKQEVSEYKARIRTISEALLLTENKMRSVENERDVLQFEVNRLHRNGSLRDECGRIAEIRRTLEEKAHHKEEGPRNIRQHFSTVSVSSTTSVIGESSFHTAVQKKYSMLCTAT